MEKHGTARLIMALVVSSLIVMLIVEGVKTARKKGWIGAPPKPTPGTNDVQDTTADINTDARVR